jgi:ABC-type uncharacterized transport system fused permease/ATPase subunit
VRTDRKEVLNRIQTTFARVFERYQKLMDWTLDIEVMKKSINRISIKLFANSPRGIINK